MDLIEVMKRFPDQQSCIQFLEGIRWGDNPECPHCGSSKVNVLIGCPDAVQSLLLAVGRYLWRWCRR